MEQTIPKEQLQQADKRTLGPYVRVLSLDEKSGLAESIADVSGLILDKEDEKSETVKVLGEEIKIMKKARRELIKQKRTGHAEAHGELFTFYVLADRTKYVYDENCILVQSGRMTADEFTEAS